MPNNANARFVAVVALVSLVIVVGAFILRQFQLKGFKGFSPNLFTTPQKANLPPDAKNAPLPPPLKVQGASPSSGQIDTYIKDVESKAFSASELDITKCDPNPKVIKVTKGQEITIKNTDSVDHSVVITSTTKFAVPAGKTAKAKIDLNPGIYPLSCETGGELKYRVGLMDIAAY